MAEHIRRHRQGKSTSERGHAGRRVRPPWLPNLLHVVLWAGLITLLSGCLLVSGEQTSEDIRDGAGNVSIDFVSAEGQQTRRIQLTDGPRMVQVIITLSVETGDVQIALLDPDGEVTFTAESEPDTQITQTAQVQTDEQGYIRYQVSARGARNGSYQLLFQSF